MSKRLQILFSYLFHATLIILGFFLLHERVDAFLVTVGIIYGVYLIFYIVVGCITYVPWVLLLHHAIGFAVDFLLHYTETIPPDSGFFSGLGQFIYLLSVPAYFALLALTHAFLYLIYRIKNNKRRNH